MQTTLSKLSVECTPEKWMAIEIPNASLPYFGDEFWHSHFQKDLWPFWSMAEALGTPRGDFPTFRCDSGAAFNPQTNNCAEVARAPAWISDFADGRAVAVQHSRQVFYYSVMFHVTGDQAALELARVGAHAWLAKF